MGGWGARTKKVEPLMKPSHPGQMQTSSPQELGTTGAENGGEVF